MVVLAFLTYFKIIRISQTTIFRSYGYDQH